jgi:hypothetical protein
VRHRDPNLLDLDDELARQRGSKRRIVDVARDGVERRPERAQLLEHSRCRDVAAVEDEISGAQTLDAWLRQTSCSPWEMGVGDDRDEHGRRG